MMIVNVNLINKNELTYFFFCLQVKKTASIKKNLHREFRKFL